MGWTHISSWETAEDLHCTAVRRNLGRTALAKFGVQVQASVVMITLSEWLTHISARLVWHQRLALLMAGCVQASAEQAVGAPQNAFSQHGRRWTHPSTQKLISPAEQPGKLITVCAQHNQVAFTSPGLTLLASSEPQYHSAIFPYSPWRLPCLVHWKAWQVTQWEEGSCKQAATRKTWEFQCLLKPGEWEDALS